jgi:hypothetical protein
VVRTPYRGPRALDPHAPSARYGRVAAAPDADLAEITSVTFKLETTVCNRFGLNCNERALAERDTRFLPISGRLTEEITVDCRSGVDTYTITAVVSWMEFDFEDRNGR